MLVDGAVERGVRGSTSASRLNSGWRRLFMILCTAIYIDYPTKKKRSPLNDDTNDEERDAVKKMHNLTSVN